MKILQYAVPRSGSTLIYQILLQLFDEKDIKYSHDFFEMKDRYLIMTRRDFRDLLVSHWRIWNGKFDDNRQLINIPTYDEIKGEINTIKHKIQVMEEYDKFYKGYNKTLIFNYEEFYGNYKFIFEKLESFLGIKISKEKRKDIIKKTCLKTKIKQQSEMKIIHTERIFDNWEDNKDIHVNHIHPSIEPKPGYWKKVIPKELHSMVNYGLEDELKKWGYWNE